MSDLTASTKNLFNEKITLDDLVEYKNFKNSFDDKINPYFKDSILNVYKDIKTYNSLQKENISTINYRIKTGCFIKTANSYKIDIEHFFLYTFDVIKNDFNYFNASDFRDEEFKKLVSAYYGKYRDQLMEIKNLFGTNIDISRQKCIGFKTKVPIKVNGVSYSCFKILLTTSFLFVEKSNVLYIHLNGKNGIDLPNHVTLPITSETYVSPSIPSSSISSSSKPLVIPSSKLHFKTLAIRSKLQILKKNTVPCHIIMKTIINNNKSQIIAETRKLEKINNINNRMIMFKTNIDFNISRNSEVSIQKVTNNPFYFLDMENEKLGPVLFALAKLDKEYLREKLNLDENEFKALYLYLQNGKYDGYYTCFENKEYDMLPNKVTDFISLDENSSVYEETLARSFKNADVYFMRDKEISKWGKLNKVRDMPTPDFYFPDGIYVNGNLCYWIELKRRSSSVSAAVKDQLLRYIQLFGAGCLLLEEGFKVIAELNIGGFSIQKLNGTYQEIILC